MSREKIVQEDPPINDDRLLAFIDGKLDDHAAERLAILIDASSELQARLEKLSPSSFLDVLKKARPSTHNNLAQDTPISSVPSYTHSSHTDSSQSGIVRVPDIANNARPDERHGASPKVPAPLAPSSGRGAGGEGLRRESTSRFIGTTSIVPSPSRIAEATASAILVRLLVSI